MMNRKLWLAPALLLAGALSAGYWLMPAPPAAPKGTVPAANPSVRLSPTPESSGLAAAQLPGSSSAAASNRPVAAPSTATPEQQAQAAALVLASFKPTTTPSDAQPVPVDLRRSQRQNAQAKPTSSTPVTAADTGLRAFPGAIAMPDQSGRADSMVTFTSLAFANFKDVRSFIANQLQPSADGVRQLVVMSDTDTRFDARVVDIANKTIQRAQLAVNDKFVVVQLSRVDAH